MRLQVAVTGWLTYSYWALYTGKYHKYLVALSRSLVAMAYLQIAGAGGCHQMRNIFLNVLRKLHKSGNRL
jgi:hypothetical protein